MTASGGTVLTPSGPMAIVSNTQQYDCRTHTAAYERRAKQRAAPRTYKKPAWVVEGRRCASHRQSRPYSRALWPATGCGASHSSSPLAAPSLACMISEKGFRAGCVVRKTLLAPCLPLGALCYPIRIALSPRRPLLLLTTHRRCSARFASRTADPFFADRPHR